MVKALREAYTNGTFVSELPISAIKWILQRETLLDVSKKVLLLQFTRASEQSNHAFHSTLAQLVEQDDCVTEALLSLFLEEVERHHEEETRVVATGLTTIIRRNSGCASRFHNHGVVSTLRRFILLQGAKAPELTLTSCAELLFNLLLWLDPEMTVDEGAWIDIASQVLMFNATSSTCLPLTLLQSIDECIRDRGKPSQVHGAWEAPSIGHRPISTTLGSSEPDKFLIVAQRIGNMFLSYSLFESIQVKKVWRNFVLST